MRLHHHINHPHSLSILYTSFLNKILKKHYLDESYDMVRQKINFLSSLNLDNLYQYYTRAGLSQEIGVVCHFLTDFFCLAHSERWEFKHSMKIHIQYERNLTKVAKDYKIINETSSSY